MDKIKLIVKPREGKTPRQLRREGIVPATLYGPGQPSENVQVDAREFGRLPSAAYSHMIELNLDGKNASAVIREVQRKSTTHQVLNIEFYRVSMDRLLTMTVPLKFVGTSAAVTGGGQLVEVFQDAEIESLPGDIPEFIEVDLANLKEIDDAIHFGDLTIATNVKVLNPSDEIVVKVVAPRAEEVVKEAAPAAEGAKAEAATPSA